MTNNLNIDVLKGKLDQKEKGSLLPIECKTIEETRRYNLERLASGFRMFAHFGFDEVLLVTLHTETLNTKIISG
jgi:hypothetical protein